MNYYQLRDAALKLLGIAEYALEHPDLVDDYDSAMWAQEIIDRLAPALDANEKESPR